MLVTSSSTSTDTRDGTQQNEFAALFSWGLRVTDILMIVVAGVLAYLLRFGHLNIALDYQREISRGVLFAVAILTPSKLYRSWRGRSLYTEMGAAAGLFSAIFVLVVLYDVAMKFSSDVSRIWLGVWIVLSVVGALTARVIIRSAADFTRESGLDTRNGVVIGSATDVNRVADSLQRHRWAGINLLGGFGVGQNSWSGGSLSNLGGVADLAAFVEENDVRQVWVALPMSEEASIKQVIAALKHSTAEIKFAPDLFGFELLNHSVERVAGMSVINLRNNPFDGEMRLLKAIEDRLLALLILILITPLMLVIAMGVKLTSPGPVLFKQLRHGRDGHPIEVWKFRSMRVHSEEEGKVTQAVKGDSRVTPFGAFLRRTSLDELPQFINVLQGKMSIVGPRPHALAHNHQFKDIVQDYMQRHRMKPGITGWAQINGLRGETDTTDKMRQRVEYDLHYMQNWSLWLDLKIIALTVIKGFVGKTAY